MPVAHLPIVLEINGQRVMLVEVAGNEPAQLRWCVEPPHQTPTATWKELAAFRNKAKELSYHSIATAALAAWEWLQREEHLFSAFEVKHYRPPERPDSVHVVHPKTGEKAWWPLFDRAGRARDLYSRDARRDRAGDGQG
jgi:hypothetical protein